MTSVKTLKMNQSARLRRPTMEVLIMVMRTMETANQLKLRSPKVNRTSLLQRTSLIAPQHQQLMDNKS